MVPLNTNVRLFLGDHRGVKYFDPKKMEGKIALLEVEPLFQGSDARDLMVASPEDATHLLVHLSPRQRLAAQLGRWPASTNGDQLILCLTTVDGFDPTSFPHRIDRVNGFHRATFFSRVAEPIKDVEGFAEFCRLTITQARFLLAGDDTTLSPSLRNALFVNGDRYLSALAILCQAYLILHVTAAPKLAEGSIDILAALDEMGFGVATRNSRGISLPIDVKEKARIMTEHWWMSVLTGVESDDADERVKFVAARIEKEWESLSGPVSNTPPPTEYAWADVNTLLRVIGLTAKEKHGSGSEQRTALEPVIVARAYRAIRRVLATRS